MTIEVVYNCFDIHILKCALWCGHSGLGLRPQFSLCYAMLCYAVYMPWCGWQSIRTSSNTMSFILQSSDVARRNF